MILQLCHFPPLSLSSSFLPYVFLSSSVRSSLPRHNYSTRTPSQMKAVRKINLFGNDCVEHSVNWVRRNEGWWSRERLSHLIFSSLKKCVKYQLSSGIRGWNKHPLIMSFSAVCSCLKKDFGWKNGLFIFATSILAIFRRCHQELGCYLAGLKEQNCI